MQFPDFCLADFYSPNAMPDEVREAHESIDKLVDACFGLTDPSAIDREVTLFATYQSLVEAE